MDFTIIGVRALPLISPSVTPRLPPPFMRAALRGSPIHQQPTQTVTYAIVSTPTAVTNTASVVSVAPAVRQPLPGPQTASSRLFGPRRVEQQRPAAPSGQSTALTLISCLPSTTVAAAAPGMFLFPNIYCIYVYHVVTILILCGHLCCICSGFE